MDTPKGQQANLTSGLSNLSDTKKAMNLEALPETKGELNKHYRKQALQRHPDRGGDVADFQALQASKEALDKLYDEDEKLDPNKVKAAEGEEHANPEEQQAQFMGASSGVQMNIPQGPSPEVSAEVAEKEEAEKEEEAGKKKKEADKKKKKAKTEEEGDTKIKGYADSMLDMLNDSYAFGKKTRRKALDALNDAYDRLTSGNFNSQNAQQQNTTQQNVDASANQQAGDLDRAEEDQLAMEEGEVVRDSQTEGAEVAEQPTFTQEQPQAMTTSPMPNSPTPQSNVLMIEDALESYETRRVQQVEESALARIEENVAEKEISPRTPSPSPGGIADID